MDNLLPITPPGRVYVSEAFSMRRSIALVVFFASGFAALLYQVVWQRLLVFFSGADVYSVTIIVAAFMAGLGAGNLAGGHLADHLSRRANLAMFVVAELAIALFALFSKEFFYDFLYQRHADIGRSAILLSTVLFLSLLWPTFFMGVSLPFLAKALTSDIRAAAPTIGALYGVNTLGAAVGAVVTTWGLLPQFGLEQSLRLGTMLNFGCAGVAMLLVLAARNEMAPINNVRRALTTEEAKATSRRSHLVTTVPGSTSHFGFRTWLLLYGISGFIALSLEIVWFRLLGVMLKSTAFTFGTLLTVYLAGLGVGALGGTILVKWSRRPVLVFLALQTTVGLYAGLSVAIFISHFATSIFPRLFEYFGESEPIGIVAAFRGLHDWWMNQPIDSSDLMQARRFGMVYVVLPLFLVLPATVLMGFSFPYLQKAVQNDPAKIGRRVGFLQVANIVGAIVGTILTGLVCLSAFGTPLTLKLVAGLAAFFAVLWSQIVFGSNHLRRFAVSVAVAFAVVLFAVLPSSDTLWARLHGTEASYVVVAEDASGVSLMKTPARGVAGQTAVFTNGLGQSWIPYGGVHTVLGALPVLLHPNPRDLAVIGLGSGDTAFSIGGRPEVKSTVCIEIIKPQLETLRRLSQRQPDAGLLKLLEDPRTRHVAGDGRTYIMRSDAHYDIIEADALRPMSAYAGNLYSREYFELLRDHLNPGGFAVTWAPTARIRYTFLSVFPYVLRFKNIEIGSLQPIEFDPALVWSRVTDDFVRDYYACAGIDIKNLIAPYVQPGEATSYGRGHERAAATMLNTDLFPKDEFNLAARFEWPRHRK
jgi:spermidine synthase